MRISIILVAAFLTAGCFPAGPPPLTTGDWPQDVTNESFKTCWNKCSFSLGSSKKLCQKFCTCFVTELHGKTSYAMMNYIADSINHNRPDTHEIESAFRLAEIAGNQCAYEK
jgi:hypothetical protein